MDSLKPVFRWLKRKRGESWDPKSTDNVSLLMTQVTPVNFRKVWKLPTNRRLQFNVLPLVRDLDSCVLCSRWWQGLNEFVTFHNCRIQAYCLFSRVKDPCRWIYLPLLISLVYLKAHRLLDVVCHIYNLKAQKFDPFAFVFSSKYLLLLILQFQTQNSLFLLCHSFLLSFCFTQSKLSIFHCTTYTPPWCSKLWLEDI